MIETSSKGKFKIDDQVMFFAYNYPRCLDIITLDERFAIKWCSKTLIQNEDSIEFYDSNIFDDIREIEEYIGWSPFSNQPLLEKKIVSSLESLGKKFESYIAKNMDRGRKLLRKNNRPIQERIIIKPINSDQQIRNAVLFGYGNYAKSVILKSIKNKMNISMIHEIDPAQIGPISNVKYNFDTSSHLRDQENYNVIFVAGYHHTHCYLAIDALKNDKYAVIEKPIATTTEQINLLQNSLNMNFSKLFACFHKRYHSFNEFIYRDLNRRNCDKISYHCIVYETPLPQNHWYNWPSSRSKIISNGCHWIDHFMYLNDFSDVIKKHACRAGNGEINVSLELNNGSIFNMILSDNGSQRLGVRDYIEIKNADTRCRIIDGKNYEAENHSKIIRKKRTNPYKTYGNMYDIIIKKIHQNEPGDSLESLRSSKVSIELDEQLI